MYFMNKSRTRSNDGSTHWLMKVCRHLHYGNGSNLAADVIDEYATATFPAIIPIPAGSKSLGLGMKRVKENVEKALVPIFYSKKGREITDERKDR